MGLVRRKLYCHRAPSDHLLLALGRWMDAAVPHMPNRYTSLLGGHLSSERPLHATLCCRIPIMPWRLGTMPTAAAGQHMPLEHRAGLYRLLSQDACQQWACSTACSAPDLSPTMLVSHEHSSR